MARRRPWTSGKKRRRVRARPFAEGLPATALLKGDHLGIRMVHYQAIIGALHGCYRQRHHGDEGHRLRLGQHYLSCAQGAETYGMYVTDAKEVGDTELAKFFQEVQDEERQRADRAKQFLAARLAK